MTTLVFHNKEKNLTLREILPQGVTFCGTNSTENSTKNFIFEKIIRINLLVDGFILEEGGRCYTLYSSFDHGISYAIGLYCKIVALFDIIKGISPIIGEVWWRVFSIFKDVVLTSRGTDIIYLNNYYTFSFKDVIISFSLPGCLEISVNGEKTKFLSPIGDKEFRKYIQNNFLRYVISFLKRRERFTFFEKSLLGFVGKIISSK